MILIGLFDTSISFRFQNFPQTNFSRFGGLYALVHREFFKFYDLNLKKFRGICLSKVEIDGARVFSLFLAAGFEADTKIEKINKIYVVS